jgi:hypothetical protein
MHFYYLTEMLKQLLIKKSIVFLAKNCIFYHHIKSSYLINIIDISHNVYYYFIYEFCDKNILVYEYYYLLLMILCSC